MKQASITEEYTTIVDKLEKEVSYTHDFATSQTLAGIYTSL